MIANRPGRGFTGQLETLFGAGTCTGLTDGQLLARFLAGRDQSGEQAFEVLVTRHGPMVLRVCRNILNDPADVHDAFQAVFMVLANRAGSIRNRESIGSWLYGVAIRVSARVRGNTIRRAMRDRRTTKAAETLVTTRQDRSAESQAILTDGAAVVHQELNRLPDKYRAPIVLCYLEGLTHDEAAVQLSWPVGTVRSRLARGRDRLRDRLARRGLTSPAVLGPLAGWLGGDHCSVPTAATAAISPEVAASIARVVSQLWEPRTATSLSAVSSSIRLAQGVLQAMMFKKLIVASCALASLGLIATGGGVFLVRRTQAQDQKPVEVKSTKKPESNIVTPPVIDPLVKKLIDAARARLEAQKAYYEEGRITLDRFVDACISLQNAELLAATNDAERLAVKNRTLELLKQIENREKAELLVGRGTNADVSEATLRVIQAEIDLKQSQKERDEKASILRRLINIEQRIQLLEVMSKATGR